MVQYSGFQSTMMYKAESSYGSEATVNTNLGRNVRWSVNMDNSLVEERGIGDTRDFSAVHYGNFVGRGSLSFELINFDFFIHILGSRTGAGSSGDPYVYTGYDSGGDYEALTSFTLEQAHDSTTDTNYTLIGCMVESATINVPLGGQITVDVNFIFKTFKIDNTIQSYTATSTASWSFAQADFERSNSSINYIQSGTITINNGLLQLRQINSRLLQNVVGGRRSYTWNLNTIMDTSALTTLYQDFTGQAVGSGPLTSGSMSITGVTLDLELTDGSNRNTTIALANSACGVLNTAVGGIGDWHAVNFSGVSKTLTITEQVSA